MPEILFTKHASGKFDLLKQFGFRLSQSQVVETITAPDRIERRGAQVLSMKSIDGEFALMVVHEERKGIIVVITFYPVKRKKYGL